ncbi:hypothetical protein LSCM4_03618 [Leishmania orientalis]|uniref:Thioredoxin domain-containing protein n=1 Tax=Leishmania orientalis TaxID=2249476 RepID=A0A836GH47_9TRYP|nr:hypothetical protein LSCM4_03618 [Leishmania orientalis]
MYTGVSSVFAACATFGALRGNWRTHVANSWVAALCSGLRTPSCACLASHPAAALVTSTHACLLGSSVMVGATAPDREEPRGRQNGASVQRRLRCTEASSPRRIKTVLTEQHMKGKPLLRAGTSRVVPRRTWMSDLASSGAVATRSEMAGDADMAPLFDGTLQHAGRDASTAEPHVGVASSTDTAGQVPSSPAAGPTYDSPPSPPPTTGSLTAMPPTLVFSFRGNPHELQERLRGAKALVFFYKASCAPCAVIRSKLFHAVGGDGVGGAGATATPPTSTMLTTRVEESCGLPPPPLAHLLQQHEPERLTGAPTAAPVAAYREATETAAIGVTTSSPGSPSITMTVEDQKSCAVASRFLDDVVKPLPHSVILLTVDTNANAEVTALHDIRSLPTFMAYRNGCIVGRFEGSHAEEINKLVDLLTEDSPEAGLTIDHGNLSQRKQQGASS